MQTSHRRWVSSAGPSSTKLPLLTLVLLLLLAVPAAPSGAQQTSPEASPGTSPGTSEEASTADTLEARGNLGPLPVARADSYSVVQDKTRTVSRPGVLRNDSKKRPLVARFVLGVEYGELSLGKGGGFTYNPDENFRGVDYFKYHACERAHPSRCSKAVVVKLTVSGDAPVANNDAFDAKKNHRKVIRAPGVLKNDTDANGDELRVISYTQPRRGGVVVGNGGYVRFTPDKNFTGNTSFTYYIGDGTDLRDSAVVTFRVRR